MVLLGNFVNMKNFSCLIIYEVFYIMSAKSPSNFYLVESKSKTTKFCDIVSGNFFKFGINKI